MCAPELVSQVDVFHAQAPYFLPLTPDFSKWRAKRVVLGSWRDVIYLALVFPVPCSAIAGALAALSAISAARKWRFVQSVLHRLALGGLTFIVLVSAHRAYFALACLLICWECRILELKVGFAPPSPSRSTAHLDALLALSCQPSRPDQHRRQHIPAI